MVAILATIVGVSLAALAAAGYAGAALPDAAVALRSDAQVRVEVGQWLAFLPEPKSPGSPVLGPPGSPTGLVIYPGGLVDPTAYAPVARAIAVAGHPVVIVPMPFRLAILGAGAADAVPGAFPDVQRWAIGGHSLGGVAAVRHVWGHGGRIAGLVLWATITDQAHSLALTSLPVLSVSATRDGNVRPAHLAAGRLSLPTTTRHVVIEGGNHRQFGSYRFQFGDEAATISADDQRARVAAATVAFLDALGSP